MNENTQPAQAPAEFASPTILISIGTDHHKFERAIDWIDQWLTVHPEMAERTLVQHGQTRPSRLARNTPFIDYSELMTTMRNSTAVIVHGGPASIFEARAQGRLPICIPRDPALGEIVDGHQQRFARHLAADGLVTLCETQDAFLSAMDALMADAESGRVTEDGRRLQGTITELDRIVRGLESRSLPDRLRGLRARAAGRV